MEGRETDRFRQQSLAELSPRLQLQMNAGVMVRRVGTVPGPFRAADRALAEAQGYQGKMQENGALQSDRVSRASEVQLGTPAGASDNNLAQTEAHLNTALPGTDGEKGGMGGGQGCLDAEGSGQTILERLGAEGSKLRGSGMKDEHIEKLYRGLHAQAVMFQQLVDQQANGRPGEDAKLMGQLLEGFHGLSKRLVEAQENDLRILKDAALLGRDLGAEQQPSAGRGQAASARRRAFLDEVAEEMEEVTGRKLSPTRGSVGVDRRTAAHGGLDNFPGSELEDAARDRERAEARIEVLQDTLHKSKLALREMEEEVKILNVENEKLREKVKDDEGTISRLRDDLRNKAGAVTEENRALAVRNEDLVSASKELQLESKAARRELEAERIRARHALRDKVVAEERAQKHRESEKAQAFSIRMLEAQMTELSNEHCRKMDEQLTRFKKDMDDYAECRRRCRALEEDLQSMRALYMDEAQSHAESKQDFAKELESVRQQIIETQKRALAAVEAEKASKELRAELEGAIEANGKMQREAQEMRSSVATVDEYRDRQNAAMRKLNVVRAEAEHARAQARTHIAELRHELEKCRSDLKHAAEGRISEKQAKDEYRIKQEALQDKAKAQQDHITSLLDQMEDIYRKSANAEAVAQDFETENSGLRARINTADAKIERLEMETEAGQRDRTKLSSLLELERKRVQDRLDDIKRLGAELERKNALVQSLQLQADENESNKAELERTKAELNRISANYAIASSEYNDVQKRLNDANIENSQLKFQADMGRTEVAELRKEVEAVQADNKRLITTKGKLQVDLENSVSRATSRQMQIVFLKSQLENTQGNHKMAAEELREKRSLVGGLQVVNEALQDELADTKKRLLQATVDLEELSKARDRLRVELKVVKGQFQKVVSGVESTLYSLEAERFELADLNKKLADAQAKSVQQFEGLLERNPGLEEAAQAILLSLRDVASEISVLGNMIDMETDAQRDLRNRLAGSEGNLRHQLIESQLSAARVSAMNGDTPAADLDDVTYLKVSKADLDRNVGLTIASRKDAAMERERANRERARRVAALKDLEDGLKDVARQRDLLSQKEDAWQADLRKMAASVEAARAQAKLRETFSQKVVDKCKELERELAKCRNLADDRNVEGGADFDEAAIEPSKGTKDVTVEGNTKAATGAGNEKERSIPDNETFPADPKVGKMQSKSRADSSLPGRVRKQGTSVGGKCPHCGASEGAPRARIPRKESRLLVMEADSAAQTDDVDLWIRNHDIVQESAFDRRRRQWTRELEMDDASCVPMSLDMLLRTIQLCYEAKGRADAAVIREKSSNELPTWHDAIFDFFLQRYGDLPMAVQKLVLMASSVRTHGKTEIDVALFGITVGILREEELAPGVLDRMQFYQPAAEGRDHGGRIEPPHAASGLNSGVLVHLPRLDARPKLQDKAPLPAEARGVAGMAGESLKGKSHDVADRGSLWKLIEEVGMGRQSVDDDAPMTRHQNSWRNFCSHMEGVAERKIVAVPSNRMELLHSLTPWFVDLAMDTPGVTSLARKASTFEYQQSLQSLDLGVPVTPTHVPQLWYLIREVCTILRIDHQPELYVRQGGKPAVYYLEAAPLVSLARNLSDPPRSTAHVPWQRRPLLVVTSGAIAVLQPSELQAAMACALGPYLAECGSGVSLDDNRVSFKGGVTLSSLASMCSLSTLAPELLMDGLPQSVVRSWPTGVGATLSRLRDSIALTGDMAAALVMQDLRTVALMILKMSAGSAVLAGSLNPDAILEETFQIDQATIPTGGLPQQRAFNLATARFSLPVLRIRELDKFMASKVFATAIQEGEPLYSYMAVRLSGREPCNTMGVHAPKVVSEAQ